MPAMVGAFRVADSGTFYPGARVNFFLTGTQTRGNVYANAELTVAAENPVVADSLGFCDFYLDSDDDLDILITTSDGATTLVSQRLVVSDQTTFLPIFSLGASETLGPIAEDIEAVSEIAGDVTTVADNVADISAVADIASDITSLATSSPVVGNIARVADAATLHAQDVVAGGAFIVTSRGDQFIYLAKTGDQSALVDRDEIVADSGIGGLVVAGGSDATGASGAWVCTPQFVEVSLYDGDAQVAVDKALEFEIPFKGDMVDRANDSYSATLDFTGLSDAQIREKFRKALIWQSQCLMTGVAAARQVGGAFDGSSSGMIWLTLPDNTRIDLDAEAYLFSPGTHPVAIQGETGPHNVLITDVSHVAGTVANNGSYRWRDVTVSLASAIDSGGMENIQVGDLAGLCISGESASGEGDGALYEGCWRVKSIASDRLSVVLEGWMHNDYLPGNITGLTADGTRNGFVNNSIYFARNKITWSGGSVQIEGLFTGLRGGRVLTRDLAFDYQGTANDGSIYYAGRGAAVFGTSNMYFGCPERAYRGFDGSLISTIGCFFGRAEHNPLTHSVENQGGGSINYKRCLGAGGIVVGQGTTAELSQSTVVGEIVVNSGVIDETAVLTVVSAARAFYAQNGGRVVLRTTTKIDHCAIGLDAIGGSLGGFVGDPVFGNNVTSQGRMAPNTIERGAVWQQNSLTNPVYPAMTVTIADDDVWESQIIGSGATIIASPNRTPVVGNFFMVLVDTLAAATTIVEPFTGAVGANITIIGSTGGTDLGADINNSADGTISVTVYEDGTDYYLQIANRSGGTLGWAFNPQGDLRMEAWTKRI